MNPSPSIFPPDIPPWVAPTPVSPIRCIPSTNILSPIENGWGSTNPFIGVSRKQVTKPELLDCIEPIPIPFELLTAIMVWFTESNPVTGAKTLTSDIVWFGAIATIEEVSMTLFDVGLNTIKLGAFI